MYKVALVALVAIAAITFMIFGINHAIDSMNAEYDNTTCATIQWNLDHPGQEQPIYNVPTNCK